MRKLIFTLVILVCIGQHLYAQTQYQVTVDKNGEKTLKGILSKEVLLQDTSFKWYAENTKAYTPNSVGLSALKQYRDSVQLIAFMGTWCEDSHFIIPKLYLLLDAAGYPQDQMTLIGTDRDKKTLGHLSESLHIKNVPTILVMKNGHELGRVIEYGKNGMWDKELGEIILAGQTK